MLAIVAVVHSNPDVVSGTPVFVGTRVPLQNLIDYLAVGDSLDHFLDQFASVTREQAVAVLELGRDAILDQVYERRRAAPRGAGGSAAE